jgi:hypothetical protein
MIITLLHAFFGEIGKEHKEIAGHPIKPGAVSEGYELKAPFALARNRNLSGLRSIIPTALYGRD